MWQQGWKELVTNYVVWLKLQGSLSAALDCGEVKRSGVLFGKFSMPAVLNTVLVLSGALPVSAWSALVKSSPCVETGF